MFDMKYYAIVEDEQKATKDYQADAAGAFDFNILGPDTFTKRLISRATLWAIKNGLAFCRTFWPVARIGRLVIVTRDADVRAVLADTETFGVPYGPEMRDLGGGADFVLGVDGEAQKTQRAIIMKAVLESDGAMLVRETRRWAENLIENARGRIDVMGDLITRVATETCATYFGFEIEDPDAFSEWSMSISDMLFADPTGSLDVRRLGLAGSARIRDVIGKAMSKVEAARRRDPNAPFPDTLVGRLMKMRGEDGLDDSEIVSILVGLIAGFIPTTTLGAGNIIDELLRRPSQLTKAKGLAKAYAGGDSAARDKLETLLFETARLNPALNPGQWRYAKKDGTIGGRAIPKDSVLVVSTASAMRDSRVIPNPNAFRLDRPKSSYGLVFGDGVHSCIGKYLAMAQIVEIMTALLSQQDVKTAPDPDGRMFRVGVFPRRLDMVFTPRGAAREQTMATILAPLRAGVDIADLTKRVEALGNPARDDIREAMTATGILHFASMHVIDVGDAGAPAPHLLLELSGDGDNGVILEAVAKHASEWLAPIFAFVEGGQGKPLLATLKANALTLNAWPSRSTGLCFYGTPQLPVPDIDMQARLTKFCREALDFYFSQRLGSGSRAYQALGFVRALIRGDETWVAAAQKPGGDPIKQAALADLLKRGAAFRSALALPQRQVLNTVAWKDRTYIDALWAYLASTQAVTAYVGFGIVALVLAMISYHLFGFDDSGQGRLVDIGHALIALAWGVASALALLTLVVGATYGYLRYKENTDVPDDRDPDIARIRIIAQRENPPGFRQNHIISVSDMKPGLFRKFTLGVALWGIAQLVTYSYRPGFIIDMGTIHFARWFRPPGREKLIFLSNFDGSWESYLEDFIMQAHNGQSAAWSNAVGFPPTSSLINDGAEDGDRFKRWVRRQQIPSQFWFNRFPELTTDQMRENAVVHYELATAKNDSQARAWLGFFGSMPAMDETIESDEVQALVFRGLRSLPAAVFVALRLPESKAARGAWLRGLVPSDDALLEGPSLTAVTFGDRPFDPNPQTRDSATFVAFSAEGLAELGLRPADQPDGLGTFPSIFNLGMASRERVLGDIADSSPRSWRWKDIPGENGAHAAILVFATDTAHCQQLLDAHLEALGEGARIVYRLDTKPFKDGAAFEPFGFRDGISQPVIRGTQRSAKGAPARDIMAPGEFILGYKNNQGYFPPTPTVNARTDLRGRLPATPFVTQSRYSAFQAPRPESRDFGRNGVFLAARQFEQYVEAFEAFTQEKAEELRHVPHIAAAAGSPVTADWVAAKMMGRWRDGTPLVDRASAITSKQPHGHVKAKLATDIDFDYATDDPQGMKCPFGAHIRRANPRGGLDPADPFQIEITNRHRILRRGRAYEIPGQQGGASEKGLLFLGLCVDIERQFEFVQQSWVTSPSFAGLTNEPDPVVAVKAPGAEPSFTIHCPAGPVALKGLKNFVDVRGGGYFFMPSRSALLYLADLNSA